jgi:hypothetical protein
MKANYLGNIQHIFDCDLLIEQIKDRQGEIHRSNIDLPPDNLNYEKHLELKNLATAAGYDNNGAMEFHHYKPGVDFDDAFVDIFSNFVQAKPLVTFVSRINPGKCVPWHWDIDQFEEENTKKGELVRCHLHLSKPYPGHVFLLEDHAFYNVDQGSVYQWHNGKSWHAGMNCGFVPKYLFSFRGYK